VAQSLPVRLFDERVGELRHERGRLELRYQGAAPRGIAQRLPPRAEPYADQDCRAFVANLLPEGDWRALLCRRLALPANDDFGLLEHLGHDCAGAVTFSETEANGTDQADDCYTPLPEPELRRWLRDPMARPSPSEAPGLRRALAGAQDKLIVHLVEGEPYLCERGAPSTVILKPDIAEGFKRIELTALNELFCMQLAGAVELCVPKSFWFAGAFGVERFDRVPHESRLLRLHQEDFVQLLGLPPTAKYDVGWRQCFELVDRHVTSPEAARRELVERLLFNLLIGNGDAHGKNFAILFGPGGARLAPAYDLLCTQIYPSLSDAFSMRIGPARRQDELTALAWQELAREARLPLEWIKQRGTELSAAVQLALKDVGPQILSQNPALRADIYPARRRDDFLLKLADAMVGNCKRVARSLVARS
jgi:serine/threonine-protein kinase HipA